MMSKAIKTAKDLVKDGYYWVKSRFMPNSKWIFQYIRRTSLTQGQEEGWAFSGPIDEPTGPLPPPELKQIATRYVRRSKGPVKVLQPALIKINRAAAKKPAGPIRTEVRFEGQPASRSAPKMLAPPLVRKR